MSEVHELWFHDGLLVRRALYLPLLVLAFHLACSALALGTDPWGRDVEHFYAELEVP